MSIAIALLNDAGRNFTVRVTGRLDEPLRWMPVIELPVDATPIKLDRAVWLIQEKMGLLLWWERPADDRPCLDPAHLLLVMESRNSVNYKPMLQPPANWGRRVWLQSMGYDLVPRPPAHFSFTLDFDK